MSLKSLSEQSLDEGLRKIRSRRASFSADAASGKGKEADRRSASVDDAPVNDKHAGHIQAVDGEVASREGYDGVAGSRVGDSEGSSRAGDGKESRAAQQKPLSRSTN